MNILFMNINNIIFIKIHVTLLSVYHSRNLIIIQILYVIENEITGFVQICFEDEEKYCLFVCVEVLRSSQPNGVMSSAVSLPNYTFTGQA